jgi:hypothetical protein
MHYHPMNLLEGWQSQRHGLRDLRGSINDPNTD